MTITFMPSNFAYYACTKNHEIAVHVTTNNALANGGVGTSLDCWVSTTAPHSKRVFDRLKRNEGLAETTDMNIRAMVSKAKGLVASIKKDYGLEFFEGERAFMERWQAFNPTQPDMWKKFISTEGLKNKHPLILIDLWEEYWQDQPDSDFHKDGGLRWAIVKRTEYQENHKRTCDILFNNS